jgi:hypothetical protein
MLSDKNKFLNLTPIKNIRASPTMSPEKPYRKKAENYKKNTSRKRRKSEKSAVVKNPRKVQMEKIRELPYSSTFHIRICTRLKSCSR